MSKYLPEKRFSFISSSHSVDSETFGVVQFTGSEGISIPYEFDIMLVSDNANINLDDMLASPVKFTIHRKNGTDADFHGMLDSFEQLHKYDNYIFYRAHLVPRLWWLSITHHNQVCLSKTVPEIIELALKDSSLHKGDFEFKLRSTYKPIGYVCQYNESHFNFISRWLEREGIYYFFDHQGPNEKIVFADSNIAHTILPDVNYIPPDGLAGKENLEILTAFICRQKQLPQKIMLKDYNYERPSLDVKGFADVDERGKGIDYIYGESFPDSEEGNRLASIRAEIHNSRRREFIGESSVPFLSPGYIFTLNGHYRIDFNQQYLVTGITHEGNQVGYLLPGITQGLKGYENNIYYRNSFTSIPASIQYRSELKAKKSRISGTLNAVIDAEGSGQYAELDNYGRYKVRLPFDESSEHRSGKASTYLRMLQPYANQKGGMQFPLTKGTEILLTFIDGDPDRPVIAGAIANPETPSPVSARNQTEAVIQTGGNNKIRIEDKKGKERIIMESPTSDSWVRIGASNDPPAPSTVLKIDNNAEHNAMSGIRVHTEDNYWVESNQRYAEYRVGMRTDAPKKSSSNNSEAPLIGDMFAKIGSEYVPGGLHDTFTGDMTTWDAILKNAHIKVSSLDSVIAQEGTTYNFGSYNQYNLGNRYVENHIDTKAELNKNETLDVMKVDDAEWNKDNVWINKKYGDTYQYTNGNSLNIQVGDIIQTTQGKVVQNIYKNNIVRYKSENEGADATVSTYDEQGNPVEESTSNITSEASSSATINFKATADAAININAAAKTEINIGASTSAVLNLATSIDLGLSLGASVKFDFSAAANAKIGIGAAFDFEMYWNPAASVKLNNGEFEYHGPGSKLDKQEELKATAQTIILDTLKAQISSQDLKLVNSKIRMEARKLSLKEGLDFNL
jgi:type VI secretion system VgrG family protein